MKIVYGTRIGTYIGLRSFCLNAVIRGLEWKEVAELEVEPGSIACNATLCSHYILFTLLIIDIRFVGYVNVLSLLIQAACILHFLSSLCC